MRLPSLLGNLAVAVASAGLCLGALEGGARLLVRRWEGQPYMRRGSIVRYHPTLGWDKPPGASARLERREYQVKLDVNAHGLRGPDRPYEKPTGTHRTLLLGDSFAEGQHQPDVVVVFFFYNDLYPNASAEQGKPHFDLDGDRLVLRNSPVPPPPEGQRLRQPERRTFRPQPWRSSMALRILSDRTSAGNPRLHRLLARFGLVEPERHQAPIPEFWAIGPDHRLEVEDMWRRTAAIFRALRDEVEQRGARLVVFYVPEHAEVNQHIWERTREKYGLGRRHWGFEKVFRRLDETCRGLSIPLIAPHAALRQVEGRGESGYFSQDGHWNETGHAFAAAELLRFLEESGWVACSPLMTSGR